jgi:hypothetical protein
VRHVFHDWTPHPDFVAIPARRCAGCGRVEVKLYNRFGRRWRWRRREHLEQLLATRRGPNGGLSL